MHPLPLTPLPHASPPPPPTLHGNTVGLYLPACTTYLSTPFHLHTATYATFANCNIYCTLAFVCAAAARGRTTPPGVPGGASPPPAYLPSALPFNMPRYADARHAGCPTPPHYPRTFPTAAHCPLALHDNAFTGLLPRSLPATGRFRKRRGRLRSWLPSGATKFLPMAHCRLLILVLDQRYYPFPTRTAATWTRTLIPWANDPAPQDNRRAPITLLPYTQFRRDLTPSPGHGRAAFPSGQYPWMALSTTTTFLPNTHTHTAHTH